MSLLDVMAAACQDITAEHCQGWIRHTKRYLAREEDIRCAVDENMWPNAGDQADFYLYFYSSVAFSVCVFCTFIQ